MVSHVSYESFLAFLIAEEEDADDSARAALHHHKQCNKDKAVRSIKLLRSPQTESTKLVDRCQAVVKTEPSEVKRRKKGGRNAEDYLQKGGMMAFYNLTDFRTHFGMTRTQVEELFTELQPHYRYERGSKLPLENVVLASLWVLSSQESYRVIAERFQTSKSVICTSLHNFCNLVSCNLENRIRWPVGPAVRKTVEGFEAAGFPGTLGAIDAFRIAISKPKDVEEPAEYMNENTIYCTTLLAVCDSGCKFTYVNVGHPGAFGDSDVFRRCELYEAFQEDPQSLLPYDLHIEDKLYTYHIIGDTAFPLSDYVMTPYEDDGYLNSKQKEYNRRQLSALMSIPRAVGLLKARFTRLKLLQMQHLAQCSVAIKACCILHNICIEDGDLDSFTLEAEDMPPLTAASHTELHEANIAGQAKRIAIANSLL